MLWAGVALAAGSLLDDCTASAVRKDAAGVQRAAGALRNLAVRESGNGAAWADLGACLAAVNNPLAEDAFNNAYRAAPGRFEKQGHLAVGAPQREHAPL